MSVISDIKSIVGLAAVGAIGYGAYRLYKQLPNIQNDIKSGIDTIDQQLNELSENTKNTFEDFTQNYIEDVKNEPDIVISDNPIETVLQPNPVIEVALQPNPVIEVVEETIIEPIKEADWSNPVKTIYNASLGGQIIKGLTGWSW